MALSGCSLNAYVIVFVFDNSFFGQGVFPHHSDQMSQGSRMSLCVPKSVSDVMTQ